MMLDEIRECGRTRGRQYRLHAGKTVSGGRAGTDGELRTVVGPAAAVLSTGELSLTEHAQQKSVSVPCRDGKSG